MTLGDPIGGIYTVPAGANLTVQPAPGVHWHITGFTTNVYYSNYNSPAILPYKYDGSKSRKTGSTRTGDTQGNGLGVTAFHGNSNQTTIVRSITANNSIYLQLQNQDGSNARSAQIEGQQIK